MFAIVQTHILPYGLLLVAVFMPIEFLIFYMFEAQKADIIGALAIFPYMALMVFLYNYLMNSPLWIAVFIIAIFTNVFCYRFSNKLYKSKGLWVILNANKNWQSAVNKKTVIVAVAILRPKIESTAQ